MQPTKSTTQAKVALACGVFGVLLALVMYWMILPAAILGLVAVVLGWQVRRKGGQELGSVALTLGLVAILLVPAVNLIANDAENWGRDCATGSTDPNC